MLAMVIPNLLCDQDVDNVLKGLRVKLTLNTVSSKYERGKTFFLKFQSSYVRIIDLFHHSVQHFGSEEKKKQKLLSLRRVVAYSEHLMACCVKDFSSLLQGIK